MSPSGNVDQSNTWLAQPSGPCCLEGTLHEGTSRGRFITVAGVETYIVKPKKSNTNGHILLYFPDVWGMFPNGLLVMDAFADSGYLVLGLDYFRGVCFSRIFHLFSTKLIVSRIRFGNIVAIVMIDQIQTSTTRPGSESICPLRMKQSHGGSMK